jgi:serine/threonine-protein kinase
MSDVTGRLSTAIADRYRLERELGQGGMATVYLAEDVRHERKVALKVLRPELAAVIGAERFLNEIKVTANLQHPHILPLHDSGEAESFLYYVMPYVEGDTLRDKLLREKQLDIQEAVAITRSIAAALDYAHRRGVIHRDIKPENILLHDGQALVADFGIALAVSAAGGSRLTETGLSIGTPHYMSPEQAMGDRQLDARSDIYSLGAMLYEMLTGDPPYTGSTAQAIVAKVITEKAPLVTIARDTVPQHVAAAIHKALAKLPADRFHSAADFAEALITPGSVAFPTAAEPGAAAPAPARRRVSPVTITLAAALAAAAGLAAWGWLRPAPPPMVARFAVALPEGQDVAGRFGSTVAISPDGSRFVYVGPGEGGTPQLWLRPVDRLAGTPIPGTSGAYSPFFSPDGQSVAFFVVPLALRVVSLAGGPPVTLTDSSPPIGGSWGPDGMIYYTRSRVSSLFRVSATGGPPEQVTARDTTKGERDHRWAQALPGGRGVLFTIWRASPDQADIAVLDFTTRKSTVLLRGVYARYAASGHIVFVREDGALLAAPFDERKLVLTGPATPLLEGVVVKAGGASEITVSASGTLVYLAGSAPTEQLVWVGRDGTEQPVDPALAQNFETVAIAPDGRRLAASYIAEGNEDVWIYDIAQRTMSRLTFEPGVDFRPVWSRDGRTITYVSNRSGERAIWRRPADGSGTAESLFARPGRPVQDARWHPDDRTLLFREGPAGATQRDIGMLVPGRDTTPTMLLTTTFNESTPRLSPDGRWLAYVSDESGRREVYVRPFPGPAGRWQVSTDGGTQPLWAHSGREIFYRAADGALIAADVRAGATFEVGARRRLFSTTMFDGDADYTTYDVTPDDRRFLFIRQAGGTRELVVVLNWFEELRQRTGR